MAWIVLDRSCSVEHLFYFMGYVALFTMDDQFGVLLCSETSLAQLGSAKILSILGTVLTLRLISAWP